MMMGYVASTSITKQSHPAAWRLLERIGYRKRSAFARPAVDVTLSGRYWDEGSRDSYTLIRADGTVQKIPQCDPPQFGGPSPDQVLALAPGEVCIRHGIDRGKPAIACLYSNAPEVFA